MLSDTKTCQMMNPVINLPQNYPVKHIVAPVPDIQERIRHFKDIKDLVNCNGLIDTRKDKLNSFNIYARICAKRYILREDTDSEDSDSSEKYACTICGSKKHCLCATCVNRKIKFFHKYAAQRRKERVKNGLAEEINKILVSDIPLTEAIYSVHESIECLKHDIDERKKAIKKKKAALKVICNRKERYHKTVEELKERCNGHQKVLCGPPSSLKILVDAYKDKLQRIIKFNAQWFLKIFPIQQVTRPEPIVDDAEKRCREMIEEACQEELNSSPNKMLTPMECGTSSEPCYTVCGCDTPDRAQYKILKGWLNIGIPTVPVARPVHNMFAAFVYTIQLVNLLTVNFDVCIPEQISFQEFSSCRKWTKGLFDTDIFKLNHAIVVLCLSLGIESKLIEPLNPFGNLLLLRNIVDDSNSVLKQNCQIFLIFLNDMIDYQPGHHTLTNDVAAVLEEDLRQICWAERERTEEDGWYIVRYRDNYYDETYDVSTPLRPIPSLNDLEEMLRDFSAFTSPSNRMSEHDFQCILGDASRQQSPEFLPRVLGIFRSFSLK